MGIGQVITMPLFFGSNAIYPTEIMPEWLRTIAHLNPLTYEVDGLRALTVVGAHSAMGLAVDYAVLGAVLLVLVFIAGWVYPRIIS